MIDDPVLVNDWHVIARSADLAEGEVTRFRLLDEDLVLWRLGERVMAWKDLCVHRGARLSLGTICGETLQCAYHGWTYNAEGRCVRIPAHPEQVPPTKARTIQYAVTERYGWVWVCLGEPAQDLPAFAEWDDSGFHNVHCGPYYAHASGPRIIENFLDVAHFPYVHGGYLGDEDYPEIKDYEVERTAEGVVATDISVYQPNADGSGVGRDVTYTYKVYRPLTAYLIKTSGDLAFSIYFAVTPVSELESIGWMYVNMNDVQGMSDDEIRGFQDTIFGQDVPVVESQRPELLPLDLQAELHLRSDRTSIAYRQWLNDLGLSFGTS
ncbi:MAG: aromatic ring-hydroxylating dioxygenase subunit alpha [Anaerolineae bacterium]|nr:aromatic ring-hydroxylating dioxygenase subunit alpha [Anaerolineae bacterium]